MWLLSFVWSMLPDSLLQCIINTVLYVGLFSTISGFFLAWIPFFNRYKLPLQLVGVILLAAGLFFKGGYATEMVWRERVKELEAKIAIAENKSKKATEQLNNKVKSQTKIIYDTKVITKEKIKVVEKLIDKECKVPKEAVDIHNEAAKVPVIEISPIVVEGDKK